MMWKILRVLVYKNSLIRKRQWKSSLFFEICFPLFFIWLLWYIHGTLSETGPSGKVYVDDTTYDIDSIKYDDMPDHISFSPNNSFTKRLMHHFKECAGIKNNLAEYPSEKYLLINPNSSNTVAIVFEDEYSTDSSKHLRYKIRSQNLNMVEKYGATKFDHYGEKRIPQLQVCIDQSFMKMKNKTTDFSINMQQLPQPAHLVIQNQADEVLRKQFLAPVLFVVLSISLLAEASRASKEKFLGVHVLMAMNGVSNAMSLLSWVISGVTFVFLFVALPTIILYNIKSGELNALFQQGNHFIICLVFIFYVSHLLIFGLHVSSYFTRAILVIFGLLIINFGSMAFRYYIVGKRFLPFLGIIFPGLLFTRAVEEIQYYELIYSGINMENLFKTGSAEYGFEGSVGMMLILSVIGFAFHFIMATYIYAINPGKYGTKKHPLFFLNQIFNKTSISHNLEDVEPTDQKLFEAVSKEVYKPGIQIRNLEKIYDIGFFNKSKVHALRGISIDFYKGQITSLLGHNGAGKTTMMSILTGMTSPSGGTVLVDSKDLKVYANEIRNDMGLCTQENMMFPDLSVREQLLFFAMLKGENKSREAIEQNIATLLEKLKLFDKRNALPSQLSGGQKRRLCLGMAVVSDPAILILDEPTSGLDPENRRVIWDILLKMKGFKTILISTHDMEEADILGDRIAILHGGQFRSYGTSFFLKKILGEGNVEVNLSMEPWCDTEQILYEFGPDTKVVNRDGSKIVLSTKSSSQLPDLLDKIESKKKEFGVTGLSVSLLTLEQVFLKVTQDKDGSTKSITPFNGNKRVSTERNFLQITRGLLYKKMTYTTKNISTFLGMLLFTLITVMYLNIIINVSWVVRPKEKKLTEIRLDMYNNPETFYKSNDFAIGQKYKTISENFSAIANEVEGLNVNQALLKYGSSNIGRYNARVVAGMEFNSANVTAFYSENLGYSVPLTINLLTNAILKNITSDDYSIDLSIQNMGVETDDVFYPRYMQELEPINLAILVLAFIPAVALFILHPLRESVTRIKHLQQITGASYLTYWGTMFLFDLVVFYLLIALIMTSLVAIDSVFDLRMYYGKEILLSLLQFGLFAIASLPFMYIFSFMNKASGSVVRTIFYVTLFLVITDFIIFIVIALELKEKYKFMLKILKHLYYLFPQISFMRGQISFFTTMKLNARCRSLPNEFYNKFCELDKSLMKEIDKCCLFDCMDGKCKNYKPYFHITDDIRWNTDLPDNFIENYYDLMESIIYLSITPILYFTILAIFEFKLVERLFVLTKKIHASDCLVDEQVKLEKIAVAEKISDLKGNNIIVNNGTFASSSAINNENFHESLLNLHNKSNHAFLVYELRKTYGKLQAVKDVSFKVNQQECFGLLGVNGAGKSTTFRMMSGDEVLDHGIMYMGDKDYKNHKNYFLSRMGYCPQNDALITTLNSYDHLRLFARLRGISENELENEIHQWIQRLNLKPCASQPSGTYSGGNKRRLNIAIALIGIPNLVLMDEPTTGVDPGARRSLWTVIQSCQATGQAVILTSHSMEECEALCNKLAIMVDGRFVCIGASQELKQRFGTDYNIQIKMNAEKSKNQTEGIKQNMKKLLDCEVSDENMGYIMYHVKPDQTSWRKMYDVMDGLKKKYDCIDDFSVSSSTLEQLFLHFAKSARNRTT